MTANLKLPELKLNLPHIPQNTLLALEKSLRNPIDYRKSGLSLNHIIGCPNDCIYCVRHIFQAYSLRQPHAIMSDDDILRCLLKSRYFSPHVTPLQLLNRATDPFLPSVKEHTHSVLKALDSEGFRNILTLITRCSVNEEDCHRLNSLRNLRVALFVTYSGIDDVRIERFNKSISAKSLKVAYANALKYRVILYWRPIIQGINDTPGQIDDVLSLGCDAHATVFTGLMYRSAIKKLFKQERIDLPYSHIARRKILPRITESKVLNAYKERKRKISPLFRKTSCAVSYVFGIPDYNAHHCVGDMCDICPDGQREICKNNYLVPTNEEIVCCLSIIGKEKTPFHLRKDALLIDLGDQDRHFLQHQLRFHVQNPKLPHVPGRHGRSNIGWD